MKKYRLIKELPGIEAGTEFIYNEGDGRKGVELVGGRNIGGLLDFIKAFGIDNDFFEPIEENKTFDNIEEGDKVWYIGTNGDIDTTYYRKSHCRSEIFLTREEAEDEHKRREWANRKDKFVPEELECYWHPTIQGTSCIKTVYAGTFDILHVNYGIAFRTKEECQDAIDNHDIIRLFYTIR